MAPGGLLLAELLADALQLQPGDRLLDLGCGRGQSTVYFATRCGVDVISLDLWIPASERLEVATVAGVADRVIALQGDIGRGIPVDAGSLDAIVCLQAFHCFGTARWLMRYLTSLLKPGGRLAIAQGCFRQEVEVLPPLFRATDGWNVEYAKYHSAGWWQRHFEANGPLTVRVATEIPDGDILWEDDVLYRGDCAGWSPQFLEHSGWLIRQIIHGRTAEPSLTHCLVMGEKPSGLLADGLGSDRRGLVHRGGAWHP
jgi:SAM-dependent methyltransferase